MLKVSEEAYALASSGNIADLKQALQIAIELEHSTMPPYFYARYSLGSNNREIHRTISGILEDEMLHMLLAGNLLKAIGGSPAIDTSEFVPDYPDSLPGTVATDLIVPLKPFSKKLVEDVFMRIEQPRHILDFEITSFEADAVAPAKQSGNSMSELPRFLPTPEMASL